MSERSCSAARSGASAPSVSVSSALAARSRSIEACDACLMESICSSESFTLFFASRTNASSASSALSKGSVICTDACDVDGDGLADATGDADGTGLAVDTGAFELPGCTVQPIANNASKKLKSKSRGNEIIVLGSLLRDIDGEMISSRDDTEQRAFPHQGASFPTARERGAT